MGASGSGKTTALYIVGASIVQRAASVTLDGVDPHHRCRRTVILAAFRNKSIGFVFAGSLLCCRNARCSKTCWRR